MEVSYSKAGYRSRLFAFFFDAMCVTFLSLLLVFVTQKIMNNVSYYKDANEKINEIQLASHLYKERDDGTLKLNQRFIKNLNGLFVVIIINLVMVTLDRKSVV